MADEGNDRGEGIYPSIAYLAWKLGDSERTVQRGLAELRSLGVVRVVEKKKFGRVFVPVYFMDVFKLPYRKPWAETRRGDTGDVSLVTGDTDDVTSVVRRGDTGGTQPVRGPEIQKREGAQTISDPAWLPTQSWAAWCEMRESRGRPLSPRARIIAIRRLDELRLGGCDPQVILEEATLRHWFEIGRPVFPEGTKGAAHGLPGRSRGARIAEDRTQRNLAAAGL